MSDPADDASLATALLRALRTTYDATNRDRFAGVLTPPVLELGDASTRLGQWRRAGRRLEISRALAFARPWPEVVAVLEHEMAHQYVDEILRVEDEAPHGPTFHRVCAERGIDARATGLPDPAPVVDDATTRILARVHKLFALAGSDNRHEAEGAMQRAHELLLRHNLDEATARAATAEPSSFEVRHVGDPARRTDRVEADLVGLLAEFFFVKVIRVPVYLAALGRTGAVYELVGTRANLEFAVHAYEFLRATCARLWTANRDDQRIASGRDRLVYQAGVIGGFRDKLLAERTTLRDTGLIWRGDRSLDTFYRARHPHITTRTRRVRVSGAHAAGREAGRHVILSRPVSGAPSTSPPRRLPRGTV